MLEHVTDGSGDRRARFVLNGGTDSGCHVALNVPGELTAERFGEEGG
jgi:hypothetical protein